MPPRKGATLDASPAYIPGICLIKTKLVWFLAPTVTLCEQQYEVFKSNLPGYGIQMLSGQDNVDHWTDQIVWETVLLNVRIVVSTHQVLYDALAHAFVSISRLALLVFDEGKHFALYLVILELNDSQLITALVIIPRIALCPISTCPD